MDTLDFEFGSLDVQKPSTPVIKRFLRLLGVDLRGLRRIRKQYCVCQGWLAGSFLGGNYNFDGDAIASGVCFSNKVEVR